MASGKALEGFQLWLPDLQCKGNGYFARRMEVVGEVLDLEPGVVPVQ